MSKVIDRINCIKAQIEEGINIIVATPVVNDCFDGNNVALSKEYTDYQNTIEAARAKIADAILDYKMTLYLHDSNSPLYEMARNLSTDLSSNLIRLHMDKNVNDALYLIDKFIAFYSDSE